MKATVTLESMAKDLKAIYGHINQHQEYDTVQRFFNIIAKLKLYTPPQISLWFVDPFLPYASVDCYNLIRRHRRSP